MKKDDFKEFVKKNPKLINYIKNNEMTWQDFYEIYDIYGDDKSAWKNYLNENSEDKQEKTAISNITLSEIINWFKNVNLDSLQEGIGSFQRVISLIQDFTKKEKNEEKDTYKPRPLYKHFED